MLSARFVALCIVVHAVLARPSTRAVPQLTSIPANATQLAFDVERHVTVAYDAAGHIIGEISESTYQPPVQRRDGGTCANIVVQDIQRLDGYQLLEDYAKVNWGDGWKELLANPSDWPDRGANACVSGDIAQITLNGDPNCVTQTQSTDGTIVGADGSVALSAMQGTSSSTQVTVTNQAQLAVGASISAKVGIPDLAEITATMTTTVTITNTLSTANTFTVNNQITQTITLQSKAGQTCHLDFDVHTCNANGSGRQKMTAHGWLWFHYDKKRNDHWYWAVNMDTIIPNEDQRSSNIEFQTSTSSDTHSSYKAVCTGGDGLDSAIDPSAPSTSTDVPSESSTDVPVTSTDAPETTSTDVPADTEVPTETTVSTVVPTETTATSSPPFTPSTSVPTSTNSTTPYPTAAPSSTSTSLPPASTDCLPALHNGMTLTQNGETFIVFKTS